LGNTPALSLQKARERARDWRELIQKGLDPKVEEERLRRTELRKQQTTFASVAEDFIEATSRGSVRRKILRGRSAKS
jgi:hypothetical protein